MFFVSTVIVWLFLIDKGVAPFEHVFPDAFYRAYNFSDSTSPIPMREGQTPSSPYKNPTYVFLNANDEVDPSNPVYTAMSFNDPAILPALKAPQSLRYAFDPYLINYFISDAYIYLRFRLFNNTPIRDVDCILATYTHRKVYDGAVHTLPVVVLSYNNFRRTLKLQVLRYDIFQIATNVIEFPERVWGEWITVVLQMKRYANAAAGFNRNETNGGYTHMVALAKDPQWGVPRKYFVQNVAPGPTLIRPWKGEHVDSFLSIGGQGFADPELTFSEDTPDLQRYGVSSFLLTAAIFSSQVVLPQTPSRYYSFEDGFQLMRDRVEEFRWQATSIPPPPPSNGSEAARTLTTGPGTSPVGTKDNSGESSSKLPLIVGLTVGSCGLFIAAFVVYKLVVRRRRSIPFSDLKSIEIDKTSTGAASLECSRDVTDEPDSAKAPRPALVPNTSTSLFTTLIDASRLPSESELTRDKLLATGYVGSVYVIDFVHDDDTGSVAALKIYDSNTNVLFNVVSYAKELQMLASLDHVNIVKFLGHATLTSGKGCLLTAFAEGLSLQDWLVPTISLVYPPHLADTVPDVYSALKCRIQAVQEAEMTISNFTSVAFRAEPLLSTTDDGRRELKQAFFGSRLAGASTAWSMEINPNAFDIPVPVLILSVGPLVFQVPVPEQYFFDPTHEFSELNDLIISSLDGLPVIPLLERIRIACETWRGVHFLHRQKPAVIHSDIKPQNILLDKALTVKVADVGLALSLNVNSRVSYVSRVDGLVGGTPGYQAPETQGDNPRFGEKNDVYGMANVLLDLFPPQTSAEIPVIQQICQILTQCLAPWKDRWNSKQLLQALEYLYAFSKDLMQEDPSAMTPTPVSSSQPSQQPSSTSSAIHTPETSQYTVPSRPSGANITVPYQHHVHHPVPEPQRIMEDWIVQRDFIPKKWTKRFARGERSGVQTSAALAIRTSGSGLPAVSYHGNLSSPTLSLPGSPFSWKDLSKVAPTGQSMKLSEAFSLQAKNSHTHQAKRNTGSGTGSGHG